MKFSIKLPPTFKRYGRALGRVAKHHYFIVTIILFSGVGVAIFWVNQTLNTPTDSTYQTEQTQATIGSKFNQSAKDTITKIKSLQKSTDTNNPQSLFPSGRINPFAE